MSVLCLHIAFIDQYCPCTSLLYVSIVSGHLFIGQYCLCTFFYRSVLSLHIFFNASIVSAHHFYRSVLSRHISTAVTPALQDKEGIIQVAALALTLYIFGSNLGQPWQCIRGLNFCSLLYKCQ